MYTTVLINMQHATSLIYFILYFTYFMQLDISRFIW